MSRLRVTRLALIAVPALLLLATPANAHQDVPSGPAVLTAPAADPDVAPIARQAPPVRAPAGPPGARPAALAWVAAPERSPTPWALLAGAGIAALVGVSRRPRAAVALGLALLVGVLAFESGVHSVHHLGDPGRASGCALASTSLNLSGLEVTSVALDRTLAAAGPAVPAAAPSDVRALPESPHEGRAPPRLA